MEERENTTHDPSPTSLRTQNQPRRERELETIERICWKKACVVEESELFSWLLGLYDAQEEGRQKSATKLEGWTRRESCEEGKAKRRTLGPLLDGFEDLHRTEKSLIDGH